MLAYIYFPKKRKEIPLFVHKIDNLKYKKEFLVFDLQNTGLKYWTRGKE